MPSAELIEGIIQDTFIIRGEQAMTALSQIEAAASRVNGVIGAVKAGFLGMLASAGIGGLATTADGLLKVNQAMEQTTTVLAGMLQANKFAKTFQEGLQLSATSMEQIRKEAEKLPGTDVDFLEAFKVTFQGMKDAGMNELPKMISFSNNLVAIAKAYGIDSQQASRDISLMLGGHAGEDVKTFRILKGQMGVKGTDEFNKLSQMERVKRMSGLLEKNEGMLKAFENTWDSISSTTESILKNTSLAFGGPLFEAAKRGLKSVNEVLTKYSDQIQLIAKTLSTGFVSGIDRVKSFVTGDVLAKFAEPLVTATSKYIALWERGVYGLYDTAMRLKPIFDNTIIPYLKAFGRVLESSYMAIADVTGTAFDKIHSVLDNYTLRMQVTTLTDYFGSAVESIGKVVIPGLHLFADAITWAAKYAKEGMGVLFHAIVTPLQMVFDVLTTGIQYVTAALRTFEQIGKAGGLTKLGLLTGGGSGIAGMYREILAGIREEAVSRLPNWVSDERAKFRMEADKLPNWVEALKNDSVPTAKPPPPTNNFYNSKFSIENRFAEGYDPDRVATAMVNKVGQAAVQRVGLTPLFSPI